MSDEGNPVPWGNRIASQTQVTCSRCHRMAVGVIERLPPGPGEESVRIVTRGFIFLSHATQTYFADDEVVLCVTCVYGPEMEREARRPKIEVATEVPK